MKNISPNASFSTTWPRVKTYAGLHLRRFALPLGGIGTGTISLGGRGDWRDWEIMNQPAKGFTPGRDRPPGAFFAIWLKDKAGSIHTRLLEGPIDLEDYESATGCVLPNHSLPRFRQAECAAAYPFGQVALSDPDLPVTVRLEAFNPLIPADAEKSGMPVVFVRFVIKNRTRRPLEGAVCGVLPNFIGAQPAAIPDPFQTVRKNRNRYRADGKLRGIFMETERTDRAASGWGTMALCAVSGKTVTWRTDWEDASWGNSLLDFWDDFSADGRLDNRSGPVSPSEGHMPRASLAVPFRLSAQGETRVSFLIAWHFPNRLTWTPRKNEAGQESVKCDCPGGCSDADFVGNYYTTRFPDAWAAAGAAAKEWSRLETETLRFVDTFIRSDLPPTVKEAALFNLSTLRSQTTFRLPSGQLMGWEGCCDKVGCCHGSCTHVWNYELATPFLFGELARTMREIEFEHATDARGLMSFRVNLPLDRAREWAFAAADGQMGCLMKLYREWRMSGDESFLRRHWPAARRALEFCWIPGGWDADQDGVMEGCQHNTMDVEYYGPNPQMTGWYLGALRACEEMARAVGEPDFSARCRLLFERGRAWMDANLFNGEYYEHRIAPPAPGSAVADGLRVGMGAAMPTDPVLQLGSGCLIDQLVGQYMAHVCGLGYLHDPERVRTTLRSVLKYNQKADFHAHFNHLRTYVLGDESAVLMATYPRGRRPRQPFPYFNEVMTGFEYTLAVGLIQEGLEPAGLDCYEAIRQRYDGRKRSPFNEAECGHHYARAMASWGAVLAIPGFDYSGIDRTMTFSARPGRWFWSNGAAWGECHLSRRRGRWTARLWVGGGVLDIKILKIRGMGERRMPGRMGVGREVRIDVAPARRPA